MKKRIFLILFIVIQCISTAAIAAQSQKWALIIGIANYLHPRDYNTKLEYAAKEANAFREYLLSPAGGQLDSEHIKLLTDDGARRENINGGINWLKNSNITTSDTVYIYISGHAILAGDNNLRLIPYDGTQADSLNDLISLDDFFRQVDSHIDPREIFIFLDVCHAGATIPSQHLVTAPGRSRMIFASAAANQNARESKQLGRSIFSYYLIEALKQTAKADESGNILAADVVNWVTNQVSAQAMSEFKLDQKPMAWPTPAPDLVLAKRLPEQPPNRQRDSEPVPGRSTVVLPPEPPLGKKSVSRRAVLWGLVGGLGIATAVGVTVGLVVGLHPCFQCLEKTLVY